jgi:hypothetical protein
MIDVTFDGRFCFRREIRVGVSVRHISASFIKINARQRRRVADEVSQSDSFLIFLALDGGFRLSFGDEEEKVACLSVSL